jgi:polyisoprenoid-binding protein YceI
MFSRTTVAIIAVVAFALGTLVGVLGWNAVTAGSGEASISASDAAATAAAAQPRATTAATTKPTTVAATQVEVTTEAQSATAEATAEAQSATTEAAAAATDAPAVAASDATVYRIDSEQSEVRFKMQEDLRGTRTDVIGITKDVGGDITVDLANPQNSSLNPIVINARTLATDQDFRNQAIRSRILRSVDAKYEFITFTPTSISGLPTAPITTGPVTFQVTGDLKIVEVTKSVTFDVTIDSVSPEQISGSGTGVINWEDFNLSIPSAPGVANITPETTLEIDFVAVAVD